MPAFLALVATVLIAIGIGIGIVSAIGLSSTPAAEQFAQQAVTSIGASQYLQLVASVSASKLGPSARVLKGLSMHMEVSATGAQSIADAKASQEGIDISIDSHGSDLFDVRVIGPAALYMRVNLKAIASMPGTSASTRKSLGQAALLIPDRWLEFPKSLLAPLERRAHALPNSGISNTEGKALSKRLSDAFQNAARIRMTESGANENKVQISIALGPLLKSVDSNLLPILGRTDPSAFAGSSKELSRVKGNATVDLYANATDANLSRFSASYSSSAGSVSTTVNVTHNAVSITAPSGATPLPNSILGALLGGIQTTAFAS